jgi:hypothetical protein
MVALEVLPLTLLLFPAAQNGVSAALGLYNTLLRSLDLHASTEQLNTVALLVIALLSGFARSVELSASEEEVELVRAAAANADRYYRTMASSNVHTPEAAMQAADAFRLVAKVRRCWSWVYWLL